MKAKALLGIAAVVSVAAALLFGGLLSGSEPSRAGTNGLLRAVEVGRLTRLGLEFQQRARETGDPTFYSRSAAALSQARRVDPDNVRIVTGMAALAAARHRFEDARLLAERARELEPASADPLGVLGDALVELGRYRRAFAAFDRMALLKPGLGSYARVSFARELVGDTAGALAAMRLAVRAGTGTQEPLAWTLVQLGNLYFDTGRLGPAKRAYEEARAAFPGYVHAEAALGRVAAAQERYPQAIAQYRRAVARLPLPQYEGALGDVLRRSGRLREARKAFGVVDLIQRLFAANGVRTELETALFDLDHGRRLADALRRAREAYRTRESIEGEDVLAWALYKNGRCAEALAHSTRALRLGTRDALKIFHRGMIELCLGHRATGERALRRALAINPHFSLVYAPVARGTLQ